MMMMMMMIMMIMSMVTAMMMVVCDHEYDDDNMQVSYFFKPRRPLMQEVSTSFIASQEAFICVTVS